MPAPKMREHVLTLRGQTLRTISENQPNRVADVADDEVIIETVRSPEGKPVDLQVVQDQADLLWDGLTIEINPDSMGYRRSSAVGAILRTLPNVEVLIDGERQRLRLAPGVLDAADSSPEGKADRIVMAAIRAHGGGASRQEVIAWATEHGGYGRSDLVVDERGRTAVERLIVTALMRASQAGRLERLGGGRYALAVAPSLAEAPGADAPGIADSPSVPGVVDEEVENGDADNTSPQAFADGLVLTTLDALGGEATKTQIIEWALTNGGFSPGRLEPQARSGRSLADMDMTWALSRAVEAGTVERPSRGVYRIGSGLPPLTNPAWEFDELILALDLYLKWRPSQPPAGHEDLVVLSDVLQRLPIHPPESRADDFRNANSVRRKLGDYTGPDPDYTGRGTKGGEGVHLVWGAFAEDPEALAAAVARIRASVDDPPLPPPDEDEAQAVEGRILIREHRVRERDPALVRKRKADALKAHGRLACEVCEVDFQARYGDLGEGFIEAHHTVPLAVGTVRVTRAEDLALVCANCHRMIHRAQPMLSIEQLRERLQT